MAFFDFLKNEDGSWNVGLIVGLVVAALLMFGIGFATSFRRTTNMPPPPAKPYRGPAMYYPGADPKEALERTRAMLYERPNYNVGLTHTGPQKPKRNTNVGRKIVTRYQLLPKNAASN